MSNPIVTIEMENGDIMKAELYPEIAPNTVNNFISLVKKGFYDGVIFHRVINGFMIQGGDPDGTGMGGPGYEIKGEFSQNGFKNDLKHSEGVLSMARTMIPDSAGSQFFIMHKNSPHLDGAYAAFGKVIEGMDVARFNFSHGDHAQHRKNKDRVEKLREELGLPVATLLDTKGPEIRVGDFKEGKVELVEGQTFTLTTEDVVGDQAKVSITYKNLVNDVKPGDTILIDDGLINMKIEKVTDKDIVCRVENGGPVSNHKGVNVPRVNLTMPYISDVDRADIIFGIENDFDFIAASFVRSADDILEIRKTPFWSYQCFL